MSRNTPLPLAVKAAVLADLSFMTVKEVAAKHKISRRAIFRYKADFDPASPLALEVQKNLNERDDTWSAELPDTLKQSLKRLSWHISQDEPDPKTIEALTKAIEALHDIQTTREMINHGEQRR